MNKLNIPILLGTNRELRQGVHAAPWLKSKIKERSDIDTVLFDVTNFELPQRNYRRNIVTASGHE
jgi:hypothetical protein